MKNKNKYRLTQEQAKKLSAKTKNSFIENILGKIGITKSMLKELILIIITLIFLPVLVFSIIGTIIRVISYF